MLHTDLPTRTVLPLPDCTDKRSGSVSAIADLRKLLFGLAGISIAFSAQAQQYNVVLVNYQDNPGTRNVLVGHLAGGYSETTHNPKLTGIFNTVVGNEAGYGITNGNNNAFFGSESGTNTISGNNNSFFGTQAGFSNRTGNSNSFVGAQAGFTNKDGYYNAFMGYNAGFYNYTGFNNVFMGVFAGFRNVDGTDNTFVGTQAGYNNTSGANNAFMGRDAGYKNTDGRRNAFIGNQAGYNNTTGSTNTYLGDGSGAWNTSGYSNVGIGVSAGFNIKTGHNSVAVGDSAAYLTTGSNNLALGSKAGFANGAGSGNTFLGNKADVMPGKTALTNAAAIGAGARVAVSNAIVLGDTTLDTKIGIGVTAPIFPLDIRGSINIRNNGSLKFASRVQLQADEDDFLVLTGAGEGQSGLRLAHLNSKTAETGTASRLLSVDEAGRVGLYQPSLLAAQVQLQVRYSADWADHVFSPEYRLAPLDEVASYVRENQHLPGIPSAEQMVQEGMDLGRMNIKLLEKVEELTLYLIEQKQELAGLRKQIDNQTNIPKP